MTASEHARVLAAIAWEAAAAKKAVDLLALDVSGRLPLTDIFLIASASNEPQLSAIARNIEQKLAEADVAAHRVEGHRDGEWLLLDFGDLVVHLFREDARAYYSLERLWKDCPVLPPAVAATSEIAAGVES